MANHPEMLWAVLQYVRFGTELRHVVNMYLYNIHLLFMTPPCEHREDVGHNFKWIRACVHNARSKVFTYRKRVTVKREVVDLVFMCDVTGGMANIGALDEVSPALLLTTSRCLVFCDSSKHNMVDNGFRPQAQ